MGEFFCESKPTKVNGNRGTVGAGCLAGFGGETQLRLEKGSRPTSLRLRSRRSLFDHALGESTSASAVTSAVEDRLTSTGGALSPAYAAYAAPTRVSGADNSIDQTPADFTLLRIRLDST